MAGKRSAAHRHTDDVRFAFANRVSHLSYNMSKPMIETMTPEQIRELTIPQLVRKSEDAFVFVIPGDGAGVYELPLSHVTSPRDGLKWIAHMSEKAWVTGEHINTFCFLIADHLGFSLH